MLPILIQQAQIQAAIITSFGLDMKKLAASTSDRRACEIRQKQALFEAKAPTKIRSSYESANQKPN